jgi:L-lactate dehydrogenase complex protein LldE
MTRSHSSGPRVGLFVTCLVDLLRPSVAFAAVKLLESAGCAVEVPAAQTCCGQPAYNAGDRSSAKAIALATIRAFSGFDYVVAPSGSCAAMLKLHYPRLMTDDADALAEARAFADRVHELASFLVNVQGLGAVDARFEGRVTYHDACSGLRELGVKAEPRLLLASVAGLELVENRDCASCCGFGGAFAVKYPEISSALADRKRAAIEDTAPDLLLAGDLGCLMHLSGRLSREGSGVGCRHVAEVLAGELADPPIAHAR